MSSKNKDKPAATAKDAGPKTGMQKVLDVVERVGNKVPHPAVIFLLLILATIVVGHILTMMGASVTFDQDSESTYKIEKVTVAARTLLSGDGIRFMYTTMIPSFMGFTAVGLLIAAMIGAGVAEEAGLVKAIIRKLVIVAPRWSMTYLLVFVGILSSVAADAGYLVLIPLAGIAFMSLGRHPLAGLAAGFAAVAGAFTVNMLIKPLDAVLTQFTNDAIHLVNPNLSLDLTANLWFSIVSVIFLTFIISFITTRMIEPRLGEYTGEKPADAEAGVTPEESRGLVWAGLALVGTLLVFGLLTLLPNAPLRNQTTGSVIGDSPFMNHLIVLIMVLFLTTGAAFGLGSGKMKGITDIVKAIEKSLGGLGGLLLLLFIISQFIAYFNYTNMATIMAVKMADMLGSGNIHPSLLLLAFIIVVMILDLLITGAIAKWAIFAPVFVPIFVRLGVDPAAVLAAYRIGDSPINMITPLNAYFAMVVVFAQKYQKDAGVGTVVALMLPYVVGISVLWTVLFLVWYTLGLPFGI